MAGVKRVRKKCDHGRQRHQCRDCGGSQVCPHGRQRNKCRDCGGSQICPHNRRRAECRDCGGSQICPHDKLRAKCRDCGGSQMCSHGRRRDQCSDCNNFVCELDNCNGRRFCTAQSLRNHMQSAHSGDPKALTKRKELTVHQALTAAGVQFEYQYHIPFESCGLCSETKRAFVDFLIPRPWGHILLEVDEEEHKHYDPSCDPRRDCDIFSSVALGTSGKVLILRYNPDGFRMGDMSCRVSQKIRTRRLLEVLEMEPPTCARWFLYYSRKAGDDLPWVAEHWAPAVRELSKCI